MGGCDCSWWESSCLVKLLVCRAVGGSLGVQLVIGKLREVQLAKVQFRRLPGCRAGSNRQTDKVLGSMVVLLGG